MCQVDGWIDAGEKAQMWGGISCEQTCLGHTAKQPTRNDYIIVNDACLPLVKGFRVLHQEGFLVHSVLQVKFEAGKVVTAYEEPKKPKSIYGILRDKSWKDWKDAQAEANETVDKEDLPGKIWEATTAKFHHQLDSEFREKEWHV